ncbi:DUF1178 family protein [Sulfitobacter sp.]|uniref:DUF1178 family protein n=1 Tax=Sulfitobacter sp. TaxID=1903071 RepID=UPI00300194BE
MIRYALKCREGHEFESWFQSASAFDALVKSGHVTCAMCGSGEVKKALMAPRVNAASEPAKQDKQAELIAKMRNEVEKNATYVGGEFAQKARDMHEGLAPEISIYGETSLDEARALLDDGVPVMPLPFKSKQKMQ